MCIIHHRLLVDKWAVKQQMGDGGNVSLVSLAFIMMIALYEQHIPTVYLEAFYIKIAHTYTYTYRLARTHRCYHSKVAGAACVMTVVERLQARVEIGSEGKM